MTSSAYGSILGYSDTKQLGDFKRVLVGDMGYIEDEVVTDGRDADVKLPVLHPSILTRRNIGIELEAHCLGSEVKVHKLTNIGSLKV